MRVKSMLIAGVATLCLLTQARATVFSIGADLADYEPQDVGATSNGVSGNLRMGTRTATGTTGTAVSAVFPFALPAIPAGEEITSANLSILTLSQTANLPVANADLYGLPIDPSPGRGFQRCLLL